MPAARHILRLTFHLVHAAARLDVLVVLRPHLGWRLEHALVHRLQPNAQQTHTAILTGIQSGSGCHTQPSLSAALCLSFHLCAHQQQLMHSTQARWIHMLMNQHGPGHHTHTLVPLDPWPLYHN